VAGRLDCQPRIPTREAACLKKPPAGNLNQIKEYTFYGLTCGISWTAEVIRAASDAQGTGGPKTLTNVRDDQYFVFSFDARRESC
jgi:hypothetical protein